MVTTPPRSRSRPPSARRSRPRGCASPPSEPPFLYVRFADSLDLAANASLHACTAALRASKPSAIVELQPAFSTLYVEWDPRLARRADVVDWIQATRPATAAVPGRDLDVRVRFDGEDLADVRKATGADVEALLQSERRTVVAVGGTPGQPFLGPIPTAIELPRRPSPRLLVPAASLAIAMRLSTVYPVSTPGGWHLVGTALDRMFDPHRDEPFLLATGDRVRLVASTDAGPGPIEPLELLPPEPALPALHVDEPGLLDLVVDGGRRGQAHNGMAQSGPVDAASALLANALVGNPAGTPLIESTLLGPQLTALRPLVVAAAGAGLALEIDGEPVGSRTVALRAGMRLRLGPAGGGARGYLAVAGGIASDAFLGSVSVDLRGGVGRPLRAGDVLGLAREAAPTARLAAQPVAPDTARPIRLVRGPQYTDEAAAALVSGSFQVTTGDRMGIRLGGPPVPGGELLSESPPLGALQVTPSGMPIILLADRLRMAGYAKPAIVHPADLGRCAQLRPGSTVRFAFDPVTVPSWYIEP